MTAPNITLNDKTVSWEAISNATSYVVNVNGTDLDSQTGLSYTLTETTAGDYVIKVKALSSDDAYTTSEYSSTVTITIEEETVTPLTATTLWVVGDSTVCSFTDDYYLPRYGYGTQLKEYLSSSVTIRNIALSGRSSRSFLEEANYETLKNGIKEGDYLMIGFGHNDEKSDDSVRYAAPTLDAKDTEKDASGNYNFQYILNKYYIEMATDKGATPILCTPIVRLNSSNNYDGTSGHITDKGNYVSCIKDLADDTSTTVIDLTTLTKTKYTSLGYDNAKLYHAVSNCKKDNNDTIVPDYSSIDNTHINKYGAKEVAYLLTKELKSTTNPLAAYVNKTLTEPTKDVDYIDAINTNKAPLTYQTVDWSSYSAADHFSTNKAQVTYDNKNVGYGLCGTGFGDTGGDPSSSVNGYIAKEVSTGVYQVGQSKADNSYKGKISTSTYGIGFLFYQIDKDYNFTMSVKAKIVKQNSDNKQAGFGLMLRDDCYTPTNNSSIVSNYVAAGLVSKAAGSAIANFSQVNGARVDGTAVAATFAVDDEATFTIKRVGQVVTCTTVYKGTTYTETYTDFDFVSIDSNYMYVGMFGARGIVAEYTDLVFTIDGVSQGA